MNMYKWITAAEKGILILIALFTIYSVGAEMYTVLMTGKITLTDLLLMFIYAEVLGMVAAFDIDWRMALGLFTGGRSSNSALAVGVESTGSNLPALGHSLKLHRHHGPVPTDHPARQGHQHGRSDLREWRGAPARHLRPGHQNGPEVSLQGLRRRPHA